MSLYKKTGSLLFGTRLKRLSDNFFTDLSKIYTDQGIRFEASWFPVFYLLGSQKEVTISKIARELEITHPGASQIVTSLKKKGFVQIAPNEEDKRVRKVTLTNSGKKKLREIRPVWQALQETMHQLPGIDGKSSRVLELLEGLEKEMARIDLVGLVEKKLQFNRFIEKSQIILYTEAHRDGFMSLVLNWIAENPTTLPENVDWINQPHEAVYKTQTAKILLAVHLDQIISACVADIDADTKTARLTFVFEKDQVSEHIIQALLETTGLELDKKGISEVTTDVEIANSNFLKLFKKNNFKLKEIENSSAAPCARLYRSMS